MACASASIREGVVRHDGRALGAHACGPGVLGACGPMGREHWTHARAEGLVMKCARGTGRARAGAWQVVRPTKPDRRGMFLFFGFSKKTSNRADSETMHLVIEAPANLIKNRRKSHFSYLIDSSFFVTLQKMNQGFTLLITRIKFYTN